MPSNTLPASALRPGDVLRDARPAYPGAWTVETVYVTTQGRIRALLRAESGKTGYLSWTAGEVVEVERNEE